MNRPEEPIDIELAKAQHQNYIQELRKHVSNVTQIKGEPNHPDCNFIEDTAIIVGDTAVITYLGAPERRGEEIAVRAALYGMGLKTVAISAPGTLDGGDVLFTGKHLFVGLSKRTNQAALNQLSLIFKGITEVVGIPVTEGLHFKSLITAFDEETLIVAANSAGQRIQKHIEEIDHPYRFISVPDAAASNVLRLGSTLLIQDGFPKSEAILKKLAAEKNVKIVKLNLSELIKADGALTCGSLLFNL